MRHVALAIYHSGIIDTSRRVRAAGSMKQPSVCPSVSQSVCPIERRQQWWLVGLLLSSLRARGELEIDDSRCVSHRTVLSSKCGQCQVNSQGARLKIQTRLSIVPRLRCGQSARLVLVHLSQ